MFYHDNEYFPEDTAKAFESLGAVKQAAIIRELIPKAQLRDQQIREAEKKGHEFNFDDGFWKPYEKRWDDACREFDFYDVIWKDIQSHPERYTHRK
jgi:hypothetical protein